MGLYELDLLIRGASVGVALLFALLVLRASDPRIRWLGLGLVVSGSAYQLVGGAFAEDWTEQTRNAVRMLAVPGVYFFWALSRLMFEDRFSVRRWHSLLIAVLLALALLRALLGGDPVPMPIRVGLRLSIRVIAVAVLLHLLWRVSSGWRDDLVEPRRRVRLIFVVAGAGLPVAAILAHWLWAPPWAEEARAVQGTAFLILKLVLITLLVDLREHDLIGPPQPPPVAADEATAKPALDDNAVDASRVLDAMHRDRAYRETGLTIGGLAERLGLPEYRLRRLINQYLGYRNFNDFLNAWRLREAAERLRDPAQARLPILSIALDLGYGSIGPFNRAFKAAMGMTPSEFRRGGTEQTLATS